MDRRNYVVPSITVMELEMSLMIASSVKCNSLNETSNGVATTFNQDEIEAESANQARINSRIYFNSSSENCE